MPTEVIITVSSTDGGSQNVDNVSTDSLRSAPAPLPIETLGSPSEAAAGTGESPGEAPAPLALHEILSASSTQDDAPAPSLVESPVADSYTEAPSPAPLADIQPQNKKH